MIKVWSDLKKLLKEPNLLSQFSPLWGNQIFPPGRADAVFKLWKTKGLGIVRDFYMPKSDTLMTFQQLQDKFQLEKKHFFKYLQLRSFIWASQNNVLTKPNISCLEEMLMKNCQKKGLISQFYNFIMSNVPETSHDRFRAWKEDLSMELSLEEWQEACRLAHTTSINTRLKMIQFKWLMRTYVTPVELNQYNSNIPDVCPKCTDYRGTLVHCMWHCTKTALFWEEIKTIIENILSKQLVMEPKLFLFGLYPERQKYTKSERIFIDLGLLNAKKCIALFWKKTCRPSGIQWIRQMLSALPLERITYMLKGKLELFESIWSPFIDYTKRLNITEDNSND